MKKIILSHLLFLSISFFLCGIQASLYFLPVALPYFWFIVLSYYSFNKSLTFSLYCNFFHIFIISQFSSISLASLLINMNILTLVFLIIRDRFRVGLLQVSVSAGLGCLFFLFNSWLFSSTLNGFYLPNILSWLGSSLTTMIFTPMIIPFISFIDRRIHTERIDTLENLRI